LRFFYSCDNNSQIYGDFIGEKSPFHVTIIVRSMVILLGGKSPFHVTIIVRSMVILLGKKVLFNSLMLITVVGLIRVNLLHTGVLFRHTDVLFRHTSVWFRQVKILEYYRYNVEEVSNIFTVQFIHDSNLFRVHRYISLYKR
jgi:hypothetical protein